MAHKVWMFAVGFLLATGVTTATAQEAIVAEESTEVTAAGTDEASRDYVKGVLSREEVRTAARIAGADLDAALDGVSSLEGERLERATQQAQMVDSALGDSAQDRITLSATTIIIVLLLILVIILVA